MGYKSTGIVLAEKPSIGIEPTRLPDRSRFGNHGTYTDITDVQLPSGLWVRSFNGSSSLVDLSNPTSLDLTRAISVSLWLNADTVDGDDFALNMSGKSAFYRSTSRIAWLSTHDVVGAKYTYSATSIIAVGLWYHVVYTYTIAETVCRIYLNGAEITYDVQQATGNNLLSVLSGNVYLSNTGSNWWAGDIGLPKIANYTFSAGRAKKIFEAERHWFGV